MLTTAEAADRLDVSTRRVRELIRLGTLRAEKFGRDWQVDEASVAAYQASARKAGRPKRIEKLPTELPTNAGVSESKESGDTAL